jgi:hypothetical protein
MLYKSLYTLLKEAADDLPFDNEFAHGRCSDINIFADNNKSTLIWLSPLRSTFTFQSQGNRLFSNYTIEIAFYNQDSIDSTNEATRKILETTDKLATKYLLDLNQKVLTSSTISDDVTITNGNKESFIKVTKSILTGQLLTFNILLPDDFDYC